MVRRILYYLTVAASILSSVTGLHGQVPEWVYHFGDGELDEGRSVAVDAEGSIYVTGFFSGEIDFDPGPEVMSITAAGVRDVFVAKFNNKYELNWVRRIGADGYDAGDGIAVDQHGNVYITGSFYERVDFDPGIDSAYLESHGFTDIFLCKLDAAGDFLWALSFGGVNSDAAESICFDTIGNVYVSGYFGDKVDFNPGVDSLILESIGQDDAFVAKYSQDGDIIWAKAFQSTGDRSKAVVCSGTSGYLYATGFFQGTIDLDPDSGIFQLVISEDTGNPYVVKLNLDGQLQWAKHFLTLESGLGTDIAADHQGNIYTTGYFMGTLDLAPDSGHYKLVSAGQNDMYILKLSGSGDLVWAKRSGTIWHDRGFAVATDHFGSVYYAGDAYNQIDLDPGVDNFSFPSFGTSDLFVVRLDTDGNFVWGTIADGISSSRISSLAITDDGKVIGTGVASGTLDYDPGPGSLNVPTAGLVDINLVSYRQEGVRGSVYNDFDENCIKDFNDKGVPCIRAIIKPGDLIVETNELGYWQVPELQPGDYTIEYWPSGKWRATCPEIIPFTVLDPDFLIVVPPYGLLSTQACTQPDISVYAPRLRRCFEDQIIRIRACNLETATFPLHDPFVLLQVDSVILVDSASLAYSMLDSVTYRFDLETMFPGDCIEFTVFMTVNCNVVLGQTTCIQAQLFPADTCIYESESIQPPIDACQMEQDNSHLTVHGSCSDDQVVFAVTNAGEPGSGDMKCYSSYRLYIDNQFILIDSLMLSGGEIEELSYSGDGRTYRLEVDQHLQHIGRSKPNATVEMCGNPLNWTSGLVNTMSSDDEDPNVDIYCGEVTGSFDPNDKTGFPTGTGMEHFILPDGKMQYVIRFQNTGTDTAFTVAIRDTLDGNLNALTVRSGVSRHPYHFRVFRSGVLEWTFDNIMLPDSNVDSEGSNGFISYTVDLQKEIPDGVQIHNSASIYFDYNDPVITNTTLHTVHRGVLELAWMHRKEQEIEECFPISVHGMEYERSGSYYQLLDGGEDGDTLLALDIIIVADDAFTAVEVNENSLTATNADATYQWIDCISAQPIAGATHQSYIPVVSGQYAVVVTEGDCTDTSACHTFLVVGIEDVPVQEKVIVYPNPSDGHITISLPSGMQNWSVRVLDMVGTELQQLHVSDSENKEVRLPSLAGTYLVNVSTRTESLWFKVIVR